MIYENDGIFLWHGTPDAPAPDAAIPPENETILTIGIYPRHKDNRVEVHYRINQEPANKLVAVSSGCCADNDIEYFEARLPALARGDILEYKAVCRCSGRQVPAANAEEYWTTIRAAPDRKLASSASRPRPLIPIDGEPRTEYRISAAITKINGAAPSANLTTSGTSMHIEGTAVGEKIFFLGTREMSREDITPQLQVSVSFRNLSEPRQASSLDLGRGWSITLPSPNGQVTVDARATYLIEPQHFGFALPVSVYVDNQPPELVILRPAPDKTVVLDGPSVSEELEVEVKDDGVVAEVRWSLDNKNYDHLITLNPINNRGIAQVALTSAQKHTILVFAKDIFNNATEQSVTIDVVSPFTPVDPADITGLIAYLADLLEFAGKRINVGGSSATEPRLLSATDFSEVFCQRFGELVNPENRAVALQDVHQTRIALDVLRQYLLKRVPQWRDHPDQLAASESGYRQQAYAALLTYLGTSAEELRRALTGDAASRLALADRLGVGAEALEGLLLASPEVSEETLERIFGLADTHVLRDPFAPNLSPPDLLVKRRAYLRAAWRQQDDAARDPLFDLPVPVIDPDLLQAADFNSTKATALFQAREQQVRNLLKALQDLPGTGLAKFEAALDLALGPRGVSKFDELAGKYNSGHDIRPQLREMRLEPAAFLSLMRIHNLLKMGGEPIAGEWEQSFSILTQVQKLRDAYMLWRSEEVEKGIALGPDDFKPQPPGSPPPQSTGLAGAPGCTPGMGPAPVRPPRSGSRRRPAIENAGGFRRSGSAAPVAGSFACAGPAGGEPRPGPGYRGRVDRRVVHRLQGQQRSEAQPRGTGDRDPAGPPVRAAHRAPCLRRGGGGNQPGGGLETGGEQCGLR